MILLAEAANGLGDISQLLQASGTVTVMLVLLYGVKGYIKELRADDAVRNEKHAEQIREIIKAGDDRLVNVTQVFDARLSSLTTEFRGEIRVVAATFQDQVRTLAESSNAAVTKLADEVREISHRIPEDDSA